VQSINNKGLQSEIGLKLNVEQSQWHQRRAAKAGGSYSPQMLPLTKQLQELKENLNTVHEVGVELVQIWAVFALEAC